MHLLLFTRELRTNISGHRVVYQEGALITFLTSFPQELEEYKGHYLEIVDRSPVLGDTVVYAGILEQGLYRESKFPGYTVSKTRIVSYGKDQYFVEFQLKGHDETCWYDSRYFLVLKMPLETFDYILKINEL